MHIKQGAIAWLVEEEAELCPLLRSVWFHWLTECRTCYSSDLPRLPFSTRCCIRHCQVLMLFWIYKEEKQHQLYVLPKNVNCG